MCTCVCVHLCGAGSSDPAYYRQRAMKVHACMHTTPHARWHT